MRYALSIDGVHYGARFESFQKASDAVDRDAVRAGRTVIIHDSESIHPGQCNAWVASQCTSFNALVFECCHVIPF